MSFNEGGSFDAEARINITANDKASGTVKTSTDKINDAWKKMHNEQRAVKREFELNNRGLVDGIKLYQSAGRIVGQVTNVYQKYTLTQMRLEAATKNVSDAELNYQLAVKKSGVGSEEAVRAAKALTDAQNEQKRISSESALANIAYAVESSAAIANGIVNIIPKLKEMREAQDATALSAGRMWAAILGPLAVGLAAGPPIVGEINKALGTDKHPVLEPLLGAPKYKLPTFDDVSKMISGEKSITDFYSPIKPGDLDSTQTVAVPPPTRNWYDIPNKNNGGGTVNGQVPAPQNVANAQGGNSTTYIINGADPEVVFGIMSKNGKDQNVYEGQSN